MSSAMETATNSNRATTAAGTLDLESDIELIHSPSASASTSKKWARPALVLLIAILAIIAVSIAVSVNTDRKITPYPPATQASAQEAKPVNGTGPKATAPTPAPTKMKQKLKTMIPTAGLTATVSAEVTSAATVPDRGDQRSMIQSPTWPG